MAQDEPLPNIFDLTPLNPAFSENPHTLLDRLREECPVRRDAAAGTFVLTRYTDVRGVLSDLSMWRDPAKAEPEAVLTRRIRDQKIEGAEEREDGDMGILLLDDP